MVTSTSTQLNINTEGVGSRTKCTGMAYSSMRMEGNMKVITLMTVSKDMECLPGQQADYTTATG